MSEFVKIEDGKIAEHISTNGPKPEAGDWREVSPEFYGHGGTPEAWVDWESGEMIPIDELIESGVVRDTRGLTVYEKMTGHPVTIEEIVEEIPEAFTEKQPAKPSDRWDEKKAAWIGDKAEEARLAKLTEIAEAQAVLSDTQMVADEALESGKVLAVENPDVYRARKEAREKIAAASA
jgi:hypothetical protein